MHKTVEEFFRTEFPIIELEESLDNQGAYWHQIRDNTATNEYLAKTVYSHLALGHMGAVYYSSLILLIGRLIGKVPNPET